MNKLTIIGIVFLLLVPIVFSLDDCKEIMYPSEVPCLLLLPVNTTTTPCNTLNVSVYNISTLLYAEIMHEYNPFKCNATFNQIAFGTYTFQYSTGDTGTIIIEEDEKQQYYLYVIGVFIFFLLVGIGYWKEDDIFIMIAGIIAMVIGINLFVYGFPNLTNAFIKNAIVLAIWGIGAYLILAPAMKFFESWK